MYVSNKKSRPSPFTTNIDRKPRFRCQEFSPDGIEEFENKGKNALAMAVAVDNGVKFLPDGIDEKNCSSTNRQILSKGKRDATLMLEFYTE